MHLIDNEDAEWGLTARATLSAKDACAKHFAGSGWRRVLTGDGTAPFLGGMTMTTDDLDRQFAKLEQSGEAWVKAVQQRNLTPDEIAKDFAQGVHAALHPCSMFVGQYIVRPVYFLSPLWGGLWIAAWFAGWHTATVNLIGATFLVLPFVLLLLAVWLEWRPEDGR
jgi:hypothetical protein